MSEKINSKELEVMIANIVKEIGVHDIFTEEMNKIVQQKVKEKAESENSETVNEDEETEEKTDSEKPKLPGVDNDENGNPIPAIDPPFHKINNFKDLPNLNNVPDGAKVMVNPEMINQMADIDPAPEQQLPSFIEKAEPGQIFVFDYNELSYGGENLSNRKFHLMSDPEQKKSIHQMWIEEGKIKVDVYMVKFEKVGQIIFNPFNGSAKLEEKRFNPELNNIAQPFNENPHEPIVSTGDEVKPTTPETNRPASERTEDDLETKVYDIVTKLIKGMTVHTTTGPAGINIPAITAGQVENPKPEEEDTMAAIAIKKEEPIFENTLRMIDLVNGEFDKIDTPKELIEGIHGNPSIAKLVSKNEEVQTWILEGCTYHLPLNIISARKCYKNKTL